jgi:competence ComEA-like helix-hairpin-helix protein
MNKFVIILLFIFLLNFVYAVCDENQIDINSASLEELDKLSGIGLAYAQRIIDGRDFNSVDNLIDIKGIGETTLEKIKTQGLACVDGKAKEPEEEEKEKNDEVIENKIEKTIEKTEIKNLSPISLNAKSIKSEDNKEILKRNLSFYGIITIGLVFGTLLLLKNRKRKNEFN